MGGAGVALEDSSMGATPGAAMGAVTSGVITVVSFEAGDGRGLAAVEWEGRTFRRVFGLGFRAGFGAERFGRVAAGFCTG